MENKSVEQQLQEINQKLDFITEHMQQHQRRLRELDELKEDLTRIGKDVFQSAVVELDEVAHHFDTADLLYLVKRLLRNTRNLANLLEQVESVSDFMKDAAPLSKQVVAQIMETLAEMEAKGYFDFAREAVKIADTIVSNFSAEDVRLLRENITPILLTVKNLTQPQMLATVDNALGFFQKMDVHVGKDVSYWQIMKEMRDPEMRRGIAFMIRFLKNMVKTNGTNNQNG